MRLDKMLSHLNYGSRKEVKAYIRKGLVTVNGVVVYDDDLKVSLDDDVIFLGNTINYTTLEYLYFNKPINCISANYSQEHATVFDYLPYEYTRRGFFTVGRLDKDTTGVLLITNDGALAYKLLNPKNNISKRYFVKFTGALIPNSIEYVKMGLVGDNIQFSPAKLEILSSDTCILEITEGKYHQVKLMISILGAKVVELKRISFASINYKDDVNPGEYIALTQDEIMSLKQLVE